MYNPWHPYLKKKKQKKKLWSRTLAYKTHVCNYDYLGGHGDFLRFIFVRTIEKLYWQANSGISQVSLGITIYYMYKQADLQICFQSA